MWRIVAVVFHWLSLLALMAFIQPPYSYRIWFMFAMLAVVATSLLMSYALLSRIRIVVHDHDGQYKAKRQPIEHGVDARTQLLLSLMSEDERARVRKRLIDGVSDGETVAIDDLLYDRQNHRSAN